MQHHFTQNWYLDQMACQDVWTIVKQLLGTEVCFDLECFDRDFRFGNTIESQTTQVKFNIKYDNDPPGLLDHKYFSFQTILFGCPSVVLVPSFPFNVIGIDQERGLSFDETPDLSHIVQRQGNDYAILYPKKHYFPTNIHIFESSKQSPHLCNFNKIGF